MVSVLLALGHSGAVRGLLLQSVAGLFDDERPKQAPYFYYGPYIEAARAGGMEAVCSNPYFAESISQNPRNRDLLMAMEPEWFIERLSKLLADLQHDARNPVCLLAEERLSTIEVPACIVRGLGGEHPPGAADTLHATLRNSEIHSIWSEAEQADLPNRDQIEVVEEQRRRVGQMFLDFLKTQIAMSTHPA